MDFALTRQPTSAMRRLDLSGSPRSRNVLGGNFFKKGLKKAKNLFDKGRNLYEKVDKHTTKARDATHKAVSSIRDQIANVSAVATPFIGAEKAAALQSRIDSKVNPYLDKASSVADKAGEIQSRARTVADMLPTKSETIQAVQAEADGGAFYQTGYERLGKGFEATGSGFEATGGGLKRKMDNALGGVSKRLRGPYGKLKRSNMMSGIHAALTSIINSLPKQPVSVELKTPEDVTKTDDQKEPTQDDKTVEESYGGLISANLPQFKNQIQAFAALIADRIATDLADNLDNDPKFSRTLTGVISAFMKVFDETGGVVPDDMFELKKRSTITKAAGGKFTMKGVSKFATKAYNTMKTIANDAGRFVKDHPELVAAAALL